MTGLQMQKGNKTSVLNEKKLYLQGKTRFIVESFKEWT